MEVSYQGLRGNPGPVIPRSEAVVKLLESQECDLARCRSFVDRLRERFSQ